jgi:hypothetical protein
MSGVFCFYRAEFGPKSSERNNIFSGLCCVSTGPNLGRNQVSGTISSLAFAVKIWCSFWYPIKAEQYLTTLIVTVLQWKIKQNKFYKMLDLCVIV